MFPILEGEYLARVLIADGGDVGFRVFDPDGEEYLLARVRTAKGSFVGKVHLAVEEVMRDIAERCFTTEYFRQDQTRRMLGLIRERYGAEPEFLWKSLPECAALRVPGKRPWFAVVGRVGRDKFGLEGEGVVEVINLKDEPSAVRERIAGGIAYPAYHMNKQHWYTLFLDGHMPDDEVVALIEKSYEIVNA